MQTLTIPTLNRVVKKDTSEIGQFVALVQQGIDAWNAAGKKLVVMLGKDPQLFDKIRKVHPEISIDMLAVFERIGRKQIYAPLLANNCAAARRLLDMPYEQQERYCTEPIEVIVRESGKSKIVKKRLHELSRAEINQVFDFDSVRSIAQQERLHRGSRIASFSTASTPVKPPASLGFFMISEDPNGHLKLEPCKDNGRAHYAKAITCTAGGWYSVVQLFKPST